MAKPIQRQPQPEVKFDLQPVDDEQFDLQPVDDEQFDLQPVEGEVSEPSTPLLEQAVDAANAVTGAIGKVVKPVMDWHADVVERQEAGMKKAGIPAHDPSDDFKNAYNRIHKEADKLGEAAATGLAQSGVNPTLSASVGFGIQSIPTLLEAIAVGAPAIKKLPKDSFTAAGERVAEIVKRATPAEEVKAVKKALIPEGEMKLPTGTTVAKRPNPQPLVGDVDDIAKLSDKAKELEEKIGGLDKELTDLIKNGPDTVAISKSEERLMLKMGELKAQRDTLAESLQEHTTKALLKPRNKKILAKIDELTDIDANPELQKLAAKESEIAYQVRLAGGMRPDLDGKLASIAKQKDAIVQRMGEERKRLAKLVLDDQDKVLQSTTEKINAIDAQLAEMKNVYTTTRQQKYAMKLEQVKESLAHAENDLIDFGYTSDEIQARMAELMDRNVAAITGRGTEISKELVDGIKNQVKDISQLNRSSVGLKYFVDDQDQVAGGAFKRDIEQPIFNNVILKREVETAFLRRAGDVKARFKLSDDESVAFRRFVEGKQEAPKGKSVEWRRAAEEYRKIYDELLDTVNEVRKRTNQPAIPKREDFVHHMRQEAVLDDLIVDPKEIDNYLKLKRNQPKLGFENKRYDIIPEEELGGAFEALEAYIHKAARYVAHAEDVDKLRFLAREAQAAGKPNLAQRFVDLANVATGDAGRLSQKGLELATGGVYSKGLQSFLQSGMTNFIKNVMVGNVGAAVNQVNSAIMNAVYMGPKNAIQSVVGGMTANMWEQIIKASVNKNYRSFARANSQVVKLFDVEDVRRLGLKGVSTAEKVGTAMMRFTNESMVIGTFNRAYKLARNAGNNHELAVKIADEIAARSQGVYENMFRPSAISSGSEVGKLIAPLNTYVFNAANVLMKDVAFAALPAEQKLLAIAQIGATGFIMNMATNVVTGKDGVSLADFVPMLRPAMYGFSGPLALIKSATTGNGLAETALLVGNPHGFGLQAIKTAKGLKRLATGETSDLREIYSGPIRER